jgi:hypothetical protein
MVVFLQCIPSAKFLIVKGAAVRKFILRSERKISYWGSYILIRTWIYNERLGQVIEYESSISEASPRRFERYYCCNLIIINKLYLVLLQLDLFIATNCNSPDIWDWGQGAVETKWIQMLLLHSLLDIQHNSDIALTFIYSILTVFTKVLFM